MPRAPEINAPTSLTRQNVVRGGRSHAQQGGLSLWIVAFIISFFVPIEIYLGDTRLTFYRIILLLAYLPMLSRIASSESGVIFRMADLFLLLFALLGSTALLMTGASISSGGIFVIEATGPYFMARAYVRTAKQYSITMNLLAICVISMLPFAIYEGLTKDPILLSLLGKVFTVPNNAIYEPRLGFDRAQTVFDHPILFGVVCSMAFSSAIYVTRRGPPPRLNFGKGLLVGLTTFFSLSSGAFVSVGFQALLIGFDLVFRRIRRRWVILVSVLAVLYVVLELASNRSLPEVLSNYIALDPGTAIVRLNVNEWAMGVIGDHFWTGIGFNPAPPPPFWVVTTSIDNFWLAIGFRHGVPTLLSLILCVGFTLYAVLRAKQEDPFVNACRTAYAITVVAVCITVITVHLWNSAYCLFIFFLGSGLWASERQPSNDDDPTSEPIESAKAGTVPYRRQHSDIKERHSAQKRERQSVGRLRGQTKYR